MRSFAHLSNPFHIFSNLFNYDHVPTFFPAVGNLRDKILDFKGRKAPVRVRVLYENRGVIDINIPQAMLQRTLVAGCCENGNQLCSVHPEKAIYDTFFRF